MENEIISKRKKPRVFISSFFQSTGSAKCVSLTQSRGSATPKDFASVDEYKRCCVTCLKGKFAKLSSNVAGNRTMQLSGLFKSENLSVPSAGIPVVPRDLTFKLTNGRSSIYAVVVLSYQESKKKKIRKFVAAVSKVPPNS
uniref:Uncharacterized protein n=1 Tax=Glossina pallidipes TaxID=7398 RepID=A0A1A9Z9X8_GLOPL